MDAIYLYNKFGRPVTWAQWVAVREILGEPWDPENLVRVY